MRVSIADSNAESARETSEMIVAEGGAAGFCEANVTSEADCSNAVDECIRAFGGVDILHNNVGIATGDGTGNSTGSGTFSVGASDDNDLHGITPQHISL